MISKKYKRKIAYEKKMKEKWQKRRKNMERKDKLEIFLKHSRLHEIFYFVIRVVNI